MGRIFQPGKTGPAVLHHSSLYIKQLGAALGLTLDNFA